MFYEKLEGKFIEAARKIQDSEHAQCKKESCNINKVSCKTQI